MKKSVLLSLLMIVPLVAAVPAAAQIQRRAVTQTARTPVAVVSKTVPSLSDGDAVAESVSDSLLRVYSYGTAYDPFDLPLPLPRSFFMPQVYDTYHFANPLKIGENLTSGDPWMEWIEDYELLDRQVHDLRYNLFLNHPELVRYNLSSLPEAPKQYQATVNPADFSITVDDNVVKPVAPTISGQEVKKRHWMRTFSASLQFSQAYVSPNWYQGGNNNLNALLHIYYNVKLNQAYHPNLLFETTAQYKLGINNAPDDTINAYNVTEDVFQLNTTFGIKAAHRWYYSFTGQFKTQVVNSYKSNTHDLRSAFLSPGELTAGVGMTYNYENKPKTFAFDASIAPVSYHLVTCVNSRIDPGAYGIDAGRKTKSSFGSTAELKLAWKISYNIRFTSRVFAFTDYDSFQADWENTLSCDVNRFLSTQIYVHARYDTNTPRCADENWHKLQVKEIFSIGFSYKFASI